MEIIDGRVKDYDERGILTVVADYPNAERFINRDFKTCRIVLNDSREISAEQRKKAYALLNEISEYISERTHSYWLERILSTAERWAYELGIYTD